jgi:hypothetical protein
MAEKDQSEKKSAPARAKPAKAKPARAKSVARSAKAKAKAKPVVKAKSVARSAKARTARTVRPSGAARTVRAARTIKGFEEMAKKKAELEAAARLVKGELRKEYAEILRKADGIKTQYKALFDEPIDSGATKAVRRAGGPGAKRKAVEPITKSEVASFIEQKDQGIGLESIKVGSRRIKTIKKIAAAYERAERKDASSVFSALK